jgi:HlyD family secretion protein
MMPNKIDTRKSLRRTLVIGYLSMFVMIGLFVAWGLLTTLNGAVIARATIVAESYSKKVQHEEGGIVSRILVNDGDRVEAGQDLVILDPTQAQASLAITQGTLDELLIKKARLEAQRDGAKNLLLAKELAARNDDPVFAEIIAGQRKLLLSSQESLLGKTNQLKQQIDQLKEQITGMDAELDSKKQQSVLIAKELVGLKKLQASGLVPISRVMAVQREAANLEGEKGSLVANRAASKSKIDEVQLRILQLTEDSKTEALTELRDTEGRLAEAKERRVAFSSKVDRTSIKAPITGTIYQMAVHTEGGVIGAGETLMLIVPEGDDLVLQAQVSPNDIAQVSLGQGAQVRFPSFNRLTPEISAKVTQVSADVSRADANSPPFYLVKITISAGEIKKLGDNKLKPGMMAEAFIQTTARSPLSYLLKPLVDQLAHTMRES